MGCCSSSLSPGTIEKYEGLTFLNKREILKVFERYKKIVSSQGLTFTEGDIPGVAIPCNVMEDITELKVNPFKDRVVNKFCSDPDTGMTFEDFLDMLSVFSDNAPREVKVEYAFRIYDFDDNDYISAEDLTEVIHRLIGTNVMDEEELGSVVKNILIESDLDDDDMLSFAEFEHVLSKAPDFMNSFRIRV